ncbi:MAG TPA: hypothetical protein VL691_14145, partial [Vicinamibacteria bacterium]|nr:hypothetical protein [Vicinamibacteria bacterium]
MEGWIDPGEPLRDRDAEDLLRAGDHEPRAVRSDAERFRSGLRVESTKRPPRPDRVLSRNEILDEDPVQPRLVLSYECYGPSPGHPAGTAESDPGAAPYENTDLEGDSRPVGDPQN